MKTDGSFGHVLIGAVTKYFFALMHLVGLNALMQMGHGASRIWS